MDDRELLELAAKASGILMQGWCYAYGTLKRNDNLSPWNPLMDDGDAFRLAVNLRLDITFYNGFEEVHAEPSNGYGFAPAKQDYSLDIFADTRRAITRSAAEIGRSMP